MGAVTLSSCLPVPRMGVPAPAAAPFPVVGFFTGASSGDGRLRILFQSPRPVAVTSAGSVEQDGTLVIDQRIVEGDKPPRMRQWRIRETAPGHWHGSLSDAVSPVTADALPERLHIRFMMKDGMRAEQWLTLAQDGQSARNIMTVRKWGVTVAVLDETITRR